MTAVPADIAALTDVAPPAAPEEQAPPANDAPHRDLAPPAEQPREQPAPSAPVAQPRAEPRPAEPRPAHRPAVPASAAVQPAPAGPARAQAEGDEAAGERTATAPQLRRFIKSRAYVPMHELRRRFAINGGDDEVTPVDLERKRVFVGLPEREGRLLGELLRAGDIGYELSLDPISPIVVGVYPMRPVTRV